MIFYLPLTQCVYNKRFQFNNYWLCIVYRVTAHNKCSKCSPADWTHALARLMRYHTLSKVQGRMRMVWQAQKCVAEVFLRFQLELNTLRFLSVPIHKYIDGWGRTNGGGGVKTVCRRIVTGVLSLFWNSWSLFKVLDTLCIDLKNCVIYMSALFMLLNLSATHATSEFHPV